MKAAPTLAVVGAINVDLVVSGAPLPGPGETVVGGTFAQHHGGKGGNQAVAAARALGATRSDPTTPQVVMIGAVGDDDLGRAALRALAEEQVSTYVYTAPETPTGVALIGVDTRGENQISVAPGANSLLTDQMVIAGLINFAPSLVLASLEVPESAVRAAAEWCWAGDIPFVLNPAPAQVWVRELLPLTSLVTPNEGEIGMLGDIPASLTIVETRGAEGGVIHEGEVATRIPAPAVEAIDATGAGDCFNGVLSAGLLEGLDLYEAARRAVIAASLSVEHAGAREGMPVRAAIEAAL